MKTRSIAAIVVATVALVAAVTGCASSKRTENMLAAAGFKIVPATTPQQQQQLKTLAAGQISVAKRKGQVFFLYPDLAHNQLYVGRNKQYDAYQNLLLDQQAAKVYQQGATDNRVADEANLQSEALNVESEDPWGVWEIWDVQ